MAENGFGIPISKTDILTENYSDILELIQGIALNPEELFSARNTWDVFIWGYETDPRELPEIPEVVRWIEKSVEMGIPWFYFMNPKSSSNGLLVFMLCCGAESDPDQPGCYVYDREKILSFVQKNLGNLADFAEENDIPDDIATAAIDDIMEFITDALQGNVKSGQDAAASDRDKLVQEALVRLTMLEELFGINPNVKRYFEDGKLYYSYLTGGGYIGSIDTINYNKRYASVVKAFEEESSYLVYHVIERENTIALLFVGDDCSCWEDERPKYAGVMAWVFDLKTNENKLGYIQVDVLQGALYRRTNAVYSSMPGKDGQASELSDIDREVIERLEILKDRGLVTDLNITKIYIQEGEICCSILQSVMREPVGVIHRISDKAQFAKLLTLLSGQFSQKIYFLMDTFEQKVAFLYVSNDPADWKAEKAALKKGYPCAIVVDLEEMSADIQQIEYEMVNGGPMGICD